MKKILLVLFTLLLCVCFTGCEVNNIYKDVTERKTEHKHEHSDKDDETSVNLNLKFDDTTKATTKENTTKTTTAEYNKTTKKKTDSEYPYTNVNDGDTTKYEWPKEGLAAEFPELKSGTMKKPFIGKNTFSVYFADVVPEEFDSYIESLKQLGFSIDDDTDKYLYVAKNDKIKVEFFYDTSKLGNNTLSLVATYL